MTKALRWRSQLCPCGFCPPGTRVEWRYVLDVKFKPHRRESMGVVDATALHSAQGGGKDRFATGPPHAANPVRP